MVDGTLDDLSLNKGPLLSEQGHPTLLFYKSKPEVASEDRLMQQSIGVFPFPARSPSRDPSGARVTPGEGRMRHRGTE